VPDNLTVTIGADSSKLRAELALVNQASKAAQKELNALATAFNKTGSDADRLKLDTKARQLDQYKRSAASLNTELAKLSPTFRRVGTDAEHAASGLHEFLHEGRGLGRIISEYTNLSRGLESISGIFGKITGGFAGGLFGVAIAKAFNAIKESIDEVSKSLSDLRKESAEIGIRPIQLQAAQRIVEGLGEDASVATTALKTLGAGLDDIRKKSEQQVGAGGTSILRGGVGRGSVAAPGVNVLRGGQTTDLGASAAQILQVEDALKALPLSELGTLKGFRIELQAFVDAASAHKFDPRGLDIISKKLLGLPQEQGVPVAIALLQKLEAEIRTLENTSGAANEKNIADNQRLIASQKELAAAWEAEMAGIAERLRPAQIALNEMLTSAVQRSNKNMAQMDAEWAADIESIKRALAAFTTWLDSTFVSAWSTAITTIEGLWTGLEDTIKGVFNTISGWLSSIGQAIGNAAQAARDYTSTAGSALGLGMASGGMVRGAGSGTSDSILARLSNGEFVMSARAVRAWGSDFLSSLNSPGFALGGLVGRLPAFAGGGAVSGTPVHLHLGGSSFALSGHDNVVSALVVEAHRQQMRSAGTKPSWFAARPGS
jgi:hypothetical protein